MYKKQEGRYNNFKQLPLILLLLPPLHPVPGLLAFRAHILEYQEYRQFKKDDDASCKKKKVRYDNYKASLFNTIWQFRHFNQHLQLNLVLGLFK